MIALVLAAAFTFVPPDTAHRVGFLVVFTLPTEGDGECGQGQAPDGFSSVACYDDRDSTELSLLAFFNPLATGDTIIWWVEVEGQRRVYVKATDDAGNVQCHRSNAIDVDGGSAGIVGAPNPPALVPPRQETFDVMGRRIAPGARSGIDFARIGKRVKKRTVLK